MNGKGERFVQGVGILAIVFAIMWLVSLIDDSRPSVRRECKRYPSADYVTLGEFDGVGSRYQCRHSGLAELLVEVPTMIVEAISNMRARLTASDDPARQ